MKTSNTKINGSVEHLLRFEEAIARGQAVPLELSGFGNSVDLLKHVIRHYHGRLDVAKAMPASGVGFVSSLESARTEISVGSFEKARSILGGLDPSTPAEKAELRLEICRVELGSGDTKQAIESARLGLEDPATSLMTRMTLFELRGEAHLALGDRTRAAADFELAIALWDAFPLASSGANANTYLVKLLAQNGDRARAEAALRRFTQVVGGLQRSELWIDRLLMVIRAEFHFAKAFETAISAYDRLGEAVELSKWLADRLTLAKCEADLAALGAGRDARTAAVHCLSTWSYLPRLDLILIFAPHGFSTLEGSPIAQSILLALSERPHSNEELFARIWKLAYVPERHAMHLRAALSKLRKKLPPNALQVNDGLISLE